MKKQILTVRLKFNKIKHDTGKAILVRIGNREYWFSYFMITKLIVNKKLGGHFEVNVKWLEEKEIYYDESMAVKFIKHHIPKKINEKVEHDKNLKR